MVMPARQAGGPLCVLRQPPRPVASISSWEKVAAVFAEAGLPAEVFNPVLGLRRRVPAWPGGRREGEQVRRQRPHHGLWRIGQSRTVFCGQHNRWIERISVHMIYQCGLPCVQSLLRHTPPSRVIPLAEKREREGAMKAIVLEGPGRVRLAEMAPPVPGPGEVLIRSRAVGICGSDVELYQGTRPQGFYRYPLVPGHEWSGEVAAAGEQAGQFQVGARVVAEGILSCGTCRNCRCGFTNLCEAGYDEIGFTRPGGLAAYVVVPARQVHLLPRDAAFEEAALLEPTAVVAQAFLHTRPQAAATVVVIGDGTIGLLAVQILRLFHPAALLLAGSHEERLAIGRGLGATRTIKSGHEDVEQCVNDATGGRGADLVFEGGSRAAGVALAMRLARRGGTVILAGVAGAGVQVSMESDIIVLKHLAVQGIFGASSAAWTYAVHLFSAGLLHLAPLITHRFALSDYQAALETVIARREGALKVLLVHHESER